MSNSQHVFLVAGSLFGFLGIAAGAFGAHFLKTKLVPESLEVYETAVRYQMYHAFALLIIGALMGSFHSGWFTMAGVMFITGTLLFSGSLYALVFTGIRAWGVVTPVGGVFFLIGWLSLLLGGCFARSI